MLDAAMPTNIINNVIGLNIDKIRKLLQMIFGCSQERVAVAVAFAHAGALAVGSAYLVDVKLILKNAVFWDVTPCGSLQEPTFRKNVVPPSSR
jgi:hypothetical protein